MWQGLVAGEDGDCIDGFCEKRSGATPVSELPVPEAEPSNNADEKCERSNNANAKVSEEEEGGGTRGAGTEIALEKTAVKEAVPLQPVEDRGRADGHTGAGGQTERSCSPWRTRFSDRNRVPSVCS